jgi:hypothetical protein
MWYGWYVGGGLTVSMSWQSRDLIEDHVTYLRAGIGEAGCAM